jgi:hypothetical protein
MITLEISREGYVSQSVHLSASNDVADLAFALLPPADMVTETSGEDAGGLFNGQSIVVPVHNAGEIAVTDVKFYGFEEGDSIGLQIVQDGTVIASTVLERSIPRNTVVLRALVSAGHVIEVRTMASYQYWTRLVFTHPR